MVVSAHTKLLQEKRMQPEAASMQPTKKQRTGGPETPQDGDGLKGVRVSTSLASILARVSFHAFCTNPTHADWAQVFFLKGTLQAASTRLRIWEPMLQKVGATITKV